ncbi:MULTISPECIES: sensor histidine kinase [Zobellia]|uniref:sensor histidine kinase n=1 Tax=Zobellia TaxID=112040 RepID=UPI0026E39F71|nr:histidine kinase dimerization/phosphoacceptor domain -containing protein [Zobellia sp. 1_MG-2023]MDO6821057.1 histidine kinase dimerization/phosphoacceptor domain -containing protein [Zobellia sp. 1_MG-2023]
MQQSTDLEKRLKSKVRLVLKVNYYSSVFSLIFAVLCFFFLDIKEVIPYIFLSFGILNLINTLAYKYHKRLTLTYNIVSMMTLAGASVITLYTGGINSPFIFVLALIVIAGYVTTKAYGTLYLYLNLLIITLIYVQSIADFSFVKNVVPDSSKNLFALLSVLFSVYLLGGVFGKNLLHAHHNLYKTKNELEEKIREKETLIKEVHHRVKNNLQTVSSLLSLQSRSIIDKDVKSLLKSSQNRVITMAIVHEMLYMREDLSKIEYKSYVQELAEYLVRSIKGTSSNITLNIDIPNIKLNIDTAIPLGLLINETVTNALKYGIADEDKGEIHIRLRKAENNEFILNLGDNGKGFPEDITHKNSKSLGLKLIHNLSRQLQGSIMRDLSQKGTHYTIKFKEIRDQITSVA